MIQRFFLDRVNAETAATAISREHDLTADAPANKTKTALALIELAKARAQAALDASIRQRRPPASGVVGFLNLRGR